ncbi:MAG: hypothetical protein QOF60_2620 [Actinomycetota bacterium]|nr:hypothetical protein [Actinomycetota bacterium]
MLTFARRLGAGGEAEVFEVAGRPGLAAKLYRRPTAERAQKLRVMLANPPAGTDAGGHVAIAWPTELVVGASGSVDGFLMPRIDLAATVPLFQVYNPASRVAIAPAFTWRYLLRTARNVAAIVDSLHRAGYVVGDINESNLLVNRRALAVLVDCDSMQVRDPSTGALLRGGVGKPEFTAPELHGRDLATTDRTTASDDFAVAVLVFQLLMEGVHPFAGVWRGRGEPPDVASRVRRGYFPYRRGARVVPPPRALPLDVLPPELRKLAWRAFTTGVRRPSARPTSAEWAAALERADDRLAACSRSGHHVYSDHRRSCPWCTRIDSGLPDPFPGPTGVSALTPRPPPFTARARTALSSAFTTATTAARAALVAAAHALAHHFATAALALAHAMVAAAHALAHAAARAALALAHALGAAASTPFRATSARARALVARSVPAAVAIAAAGALLPALAGLAWLLGAITSLSRTQRAQTAREVGTAAVTAIVALAVVSGGGPPWRATLTTAVALLPALRWSVLAAKGARSGAVGGHFRPMRAWAAAAGAVAALAILGPQWWPLAGGR